MATLPHLPHVYQMPITDTSVFRTRSRGILRCSTHKLQIMSVYSLTVVYTRFFLQVALLLPSHNCKKHQNEILLSVYF